MSNRSDYALLLVNFGGPRSLLEVEPFLKALLNDRDVIWSRLPSFMHRILFNRIAKQRARLVASDYRLIGGASPIFADTEALAKNLRHKGFNPVMTFHRYLTATHPDSLATILSTECKEIRVLPLFPQFSYATTGSIARFFANHLPLYCSRKLRWVKSYCGHFAYIAAMSEVLRGFLEKNRLVEEEIVLLFSAHGLPQRFICMGDLYQDECRTSFEIIRNKFPQAHSLLSYQSKFGPGEWIRPYTVDTCEQIIAQSKGRRKVVVVPLSFTSDHIETLYEIEHQYLPILRNQGMEAWRCPAMNLEEVWIDAIPQLIDETNLVANDMLIRPEHRKMCCGAREKCVHSQ